MFHQDNARPHTAKITSQKIEEVGWEKIPHPSYSPDLAPSDYYLFRSLQNHLEDITFASQEEVETDLSEFFALKPNEFYIDGIKKLVNRRKEVIDNHGKEKNQTLAIVLNKCKKEYDSELERMKEKTHWNIKRKRHVSDTSKQEYLTKAVPVFYSSLAGVENSDRLCDSAVKVAKRCYEKYLKDKLDSAENKSEETFDRVGHKTKSVDVRDALFEWFVDIRTSLHARFLQALFLLKAKKFSKEQSVERNQVNLKNIWIVCHYFLDRFGVDPLIINGDQMPLHQNEISEHATLSFRNRDTFVKENYHLSKECITVFTQVNNDAKINLIPKSVFKRTGKILPLLNQWSPKVSYRLEQLFCTVENLPNRFNMFSHASFAIYTLDDHMVHLMPEVRVIIGRGVTEFVQVNDRHLHKQLKSKYREMENEKMLEKLVQTPNHMLRMLHQAHADCKIGVEAAFKSMWATNVFDVSEDYVSDRIMHLVGLSVREFRLEMMSKPCPNTIQRVIKHLIPPKGVKRANNIEGSELFDGDSIEEKATGSETEDESESEVIDTSEEILMEVSQEPKLGRLNMMTGSSISFVGISSDDQVNKSASFLEKIENVLDENETSTIPCHIEANSFQLSVKPSDL
uniref:Histone-lysine N-methyltransferase SETMAR n=1 Tax=Octopus bimaculoides TaxID=37653 RepID=A0A0L8GRU9_OCTBM